jgi:hypothetical protein
MFRSRRGAYHFNFCVLLRPDCLAGLGSPPTHKFLVSANPVCTGACISHIGGLPNAIDDGAFRWKEMPLQWNRAGAPSTVRNYCQQFTCKGKYLNERVHMLRWSMVFRLYGAFGW